MSLRSYEWKTHDGKTLSVAEWKGEGELVGMVQISHGMVEHTGRYDAFASALAEQGFLVFADDHRGHGRTDESTLGYAPGDMFEDTLKDLAELSKKYKAEYPQLPLVLFGHSYGSFLTQGYIERYSAYLAGVVIGGSCCMKGNPSVGFGRMMAGIGCACKGERAPAKLIAKATFGAYEKKLGGSFISSDPAEVERYRSDPYCSFICSNHFYRCFFRGLKKIYRKKELDGIDRSLPIFLIAGNCDPVGQMGKGVKRLEAMYKKLGCKSVECLIMDGIRHEYLNDREAAAAREAIFGFIGRTAANAKKE